MTRTKSLDTQTIMGAMMLILGVVLLSAPSSLLAAQLSSDQTTTTIKPAHSRPIFREADREFAELTNTLKNPGGASKNAETPLGDLRSSERLMKELKSIYKSDNFKRGIFAVELVNLNMYEWRVNLTFPEPGCALHSELERLKSEGKEAHVVLHISFTERYPKEPPLVEIIYPVLADESIRPNGALTMNLLTKEGWNKDLSMEAVVLSIAKHLIETNAKIRVGEYYNEGEAQNTFTILEKIHKFLGW